MQKKEHVLFDQQSNSQQEIDLETINDRQKLLITQLSYLNVTKEGLEKIKDGLTIADLKNYLETPDSFVYGEPIVGKHATENMAKVVIGEEAYQTDKELLDEMIANGLGDVKITGWVDNPRTGLQACSFEDQAGNTGISYRGSDFDKGGIIGDWGIADGAEYFTDHQHQFKEAEEFFNDKKDPNGNTYIYGHSLGGNLVSYMMLNHSEDIKYAFSFNGNPINQELLDTPEKLAAFKSDKFDFTVVCGDLVGHFKEHSLYSENVRYIQNSAVGRENPMQAHLPQAAKFDANGNFVYATEEQMLAYMNPQAQSAASWMHDNKSVVDGLRSGEINIKDLFQDAINGDIKFDQGHTENVINVDDLFRSENSQHQKLDLKTMAQTAGELFVAGVKGTLQDIGENVENKAHELSEKASGAVDAIKNGFEDIGDNVMEFLDRD